MKILKLVMICIALSLVVKAEDGSDLWLRSEMSTTTTPRIHTNKQSQIISIATNELKLYWKGLPIHLRVGNNAITKSLHLDGFVLDYKKNKICVYARTDKGILYGSYALLRAQETNLPMTSKRIIENPSYDLRILNHWDNLDGSVERGYSGRSIWEWGALPDVVSPRYQAYARANASVGINGTVLNNVNANPQILSAEYLSKVKIIADILRTYGIKVYLSANFASPMVLGNTENADPLNPQVIAWWKDKVQEIYALIPDFGGFLVKANSEGQPGPLDYGRTHADGANMLADVLKPYQGIVMWRAFVYNPTDDDRAKQAYSQFQPLDGKFRDNVIVQIKNGAIDFQPREPFHPLFGTMQHTATMPELQITQEYLGASNHLVFLAPQWKEFLESDTYCRGESSTVAKVTDGTLFSHQPSAIAGVANIGKDVNWCGHPFAQANWYAFGRLAWNHTLSSEQIAEEWLHQTFTDNTHFVNPVKEIMLSSWETVVNYMMPLGLHHLFAWDHHYGPEPWCDIPGARADWLPKYYHNADATGLGFNRSSSGSNAIAQYYSPLKEQFNSIESCPEELLLWFHHIPWNHIMKNGNSLWEELCYHYDAGVQEVRSFQKQWNKLEGLIDTERFKQVQEKLVIQESDAIWWRDACLLYFQTFSNLPIPQDIEQPVHRLEDLKKIKLDLKHHN